MGLPQALGLAPVEADASRKQVPAVLVRSTVEEMIYRQAVRHEIYAKQLEQAFAAGQEEEIKRTGEIRFAGFLTQILNALGVSAGNDETVRLIIAVLTQMMDRGDVSLKARAEEQKDGQFCCYSSIRNTGNVFWRLCPGRFPVISGSFSAWPSFSGGTMISPSGQRRILPCCSPWNPVTPGI